MYALCHLRAIEANLYSCHPFYSVLTPLAPSLTILKPHKQNWLQTHLGKLQTRKLSVAGVTIKSIGNPTDQ